MFRAVSELAVVATPLSLTSSNFYHTVIRHIAGGRKL